MVSNKRSVSVRTHTADFSTEKSVANLHMLHADFIYLCSEIFITYIRKRKKSAGKIRNRNWHALDFRIGTACQFLCGKACSMWMRYVPSTWLLLYTAEDCTCANPQLKSAAFPPCLKRRGWFCWCHFFLIACGWFFSSDLDADIITTL